MRTIYQIKNTARQVIAEHIRVDLPNGKKQMAWHRPGRNPKDGLCGLPLADLPLYGSERLADLPVGAMVAAAEGERATEALWALGIPAVGTVTGASSTPGEDALSVLLPFDVVLWADHDREGYLHMNRVAWALHRLSRHLPRGISPSRTLRDGTVVQWIAPKGFDAADLEHRANRAALVSRMLSAAETWQLHQEVQPVPKPIRTTYMRSYSDDGRVDTAKSHMAQVAIQKLGQPVRQDRRGLWWPCPFHADRTPSFKVDLREPFYRCFGCDARGDVFTFLREIEGVEFKDALRELAPAVGMGAMPRLWG